MVGIVLLECLFLCFICDIMGLSIMSLILAAVFLLLLCLGDGLSGVLMGFIIIPYLLVCGIVSVVTFLFG